MDNQLEDLCTRTLMELSDHLTVTFAPVTVPTQSDLGVEDSYRDFGRWEGAPATPGTQQIQASPKPCGKTKDEKLGVSGNVVMTTPLKAKTTRSARLIIAQTHRSTGDAKTDLRFRQLSTEPQGLSEDDGRRHGLTAQHSTPHIKKLVDNYAQNIVTSSSFLQLPNFNIEARKERKRNSLYGEKDELVKARRKPPVPKAFLRRKSTLSELHIAEGNKVVCTPRNALSPLPIASVRTGIALSELGHNRVSKRRGPQGAYTLAPLTLPFDPFAQP